MQISCAFCAWPAQPSAPSGAHGVPTVPITAGSGSPPPAPALPAAPLAPPVAGPPLAPPVLVPPVPPVSVPPVLLPPPPVSPAAPARPPLPELCPPVPPELSLNWRSVFPHAKSNAGKLRTPSQLAPVLRRIIDRESFIADLQTVRRDTELVQCGALGTARAAEAEIDLGDRRRGDGRRHVPRLELADLR